MKRALSSVSIRLVAAVLVLSVWQCPAASAAAAAFPELKQADIDSFVKYLPVFLEIRTLPASPDSRKKMDAFAAENNLDVDRFILAGYKILLGVGMESGMRSIAALLDDIPILVMPNASEMDLIRQNQAAINAAIREQVGDAYLASLQERMRDDRLALEIYLVASLLYPNAVNPEKNLPALLDYVLPEREALWEEIVAALVDVAQQNHDAAALRLEAALENYSEEWLGAPTHSFLMRLYATTLQLQGKTDSALPILDAIFERYGGSGDDMVIQQTVIALFTKGLLCMQTGRNDEALRVFETVIQTYRDRTEQIVMLQVATAYNNQAVIHTQGGRVADAMAAFDACLDRYWEREEPVVVEIAARVAVAKGVLLLQTGKLDEADAVFNRVITRCASNPYGGIAKHAATAMNNRIVTAEMRKDDDRAKREMWRMVDLLGGRTEPEVLEWVGSALFGRAVTTASDGRIGDSIESLRLLAENERFGDVPALRERVADGIWFLAATYYEMKDYREATRVLERMIPRFEDDSDPKVQARVAQAMGMLGLAQAENGDAESALATLNRLTEKFIDSGHSGVQEQVASGMRFGAETLLAHGRADEALAILTRLIEQFGTSTDTRLSLDVMYARSATSDPSDAGMIAQVIKFTFRRAVRGKVDVLATHERLMNQYGERSEPVIEAALAEAMIGKGEYLWNNGRNEEAMAVYNEVLHRYGTRSDARMHLPIARALSLLSSKYAEIGDTERGIEGYERIIRDYGGTDETVLQSYVRGAKKKLEALTAKTQ